MVSAIAIGVPSMWGDEAASVMSAERPWDSLWAMAANVDAVHALCYAFLHVWIDLFGASAFSVRLPSALAVGVTVAGVYTLCRSFAGARTAIVASIACTLLPRVDYMAAEARSAASTAAFATWLTVLLVHLVRHPGLVTQWFGSVPIDPGLVRPYETTEHLWDVVAPLGERPHVLDGRTRVWVVARSTDGTSADEQTLLSAGFHRTTTFRLSRDVIKLYSKDVS